MEGVAGSGAERERSGRSRCGAERAAGAGGGGRGRPRPERPGAGTSGTFWDLRGSPGFRPETVRTRCRGPRRLRRPGRHGQVGSGGPALDRGGAGGRDQREQLALVRRAAAGPRARAAGGRGGGRAAPQHACPWRETVRNCPGPPASGASRKLGQAPRGTGASPPPTSVPRSPLTRPFRAGAA